MPSSAPNPSGTPRDAVQLLAAEARAMRQALLGADQASIEDCLERFEHAAAIYRNTFQTFEYAPGMADPRGLKRDLTALRKDLAPVAQLAHSGAALCEGMARLLGAAAGGYTSLGEGAPLRGSVGVLVRG